MPPTKKKTVRKQVLSSREVSMLRNGLSDLIGFDIFSQGSQLSQATTLFANNRNYLVSNMRQLMSQVYVEHGLVKTLVDVPVDDGLRGGIDLKSKQLSPEEIERLHTYLERNGVLAVAGQATKWNRLYGGGAILIMTGQDPATPFDISSLKAGDKLGYKAADLWELYNGKHDEDRHDMEIVEKIDDPRTDCYSYYNRKIHKSRVMKLVGVEAPSFIRPRLRGWGLSILETLVRSINQYLKANNLSFEVLDEFKIDVFKMQGLTETLQSDDGIAAAKRRLSLANQQKNYQSALVMDKEDDYAQKQLSFTGIGEVMKEIRMQIASDMRMPLTKLFGISAAGFSSGEDDIENYNAMVESEIRGKIKYDILRMVELSCQHLFGQVPTDLAISFKPLRMLSAEQEENVKTQKFTRLLQAVQGGYISRKDFSDGCNRDNLLSVQVDPDEVIEMDDPEQDKPKEEKDE